MCWPTKARSVEVGLVVAMLGRVGLDRDEADDAGPREQRGAKPVAVRLDGTDLLDLAAGHERLEHRAVHQHGSPESQDVGRHAAGGGIAQGLPGRRVGDVVSTAST